MRARPVLHSLPLKATCNREQRHLVLRPQRIQPSGGLPLRPVLVLHSRSLKVTSNGVLRHLVLGIQPSGGLPLRARSVPVSPEPRLLKAAYDIIRRHLFPRLQEMRPIGDSLLRARSALAGSLSSTRTATAR